MSEQGKLPAPSSKSAATETMPSTSKSGSNLTRIQRNVAEKQRRDKLNGYISELANIVPMVSMSSKRLDKTSILRLSAAHLRLSKSPLSGSKKLKKSFKWCPSFLTAQQVREILESVDGFLIVTSSSGKILFTSSSVERYLGHQNIDMIGHSLFVFIHPEDLDSVKAEMERLLSASLKCGDSGPAPRCSFRCRMKEKGQPRSEVATYQFVHFAGDMTISDEEDGASKNTKSTAIVTHIFKAFVRIVDANPYCQLSLEDATADEYVTRHSLDGTIIFADHRLSTITGHLPQEVIGLSAYKYILPEDISIALFAHHLMFSSDKGTGMIVYRLRTQDDKFVYLKSVGCLQFDRATSQVDHFVCVNQHLSDAEGEAQLKYFVDRFIPHIRDSSALTLFESVKALQVMGVKAPSSVGGINENITFSKFSAPDSKVLKSDSSNENGYKNKSSKDTITNSSVLFSKDKSTENPNVVVSKSAELSQVSSLKKASSDKNIGTEISISSASKQNQCKNKNSSYSEADSGSRKKKATSNISYNGAQSDIKPLVSNTNSSSASNRTIPITHLHPVQNGISTGKLPSSNKTLISHLSAHNVSIKKELLGSSDAGNSAFSIGKERKELKNHNTGFPVGCQGEDSSSQTMKKSNCVQARISSVSVSNNSKDSSFHVLPLNGEIIHSDLQTSVRKGYDPKVHTEFNASNTANMNQMKEENFPGIKSNILLSTGSIMFKNNLQQKVSTAVARDNGELVRIEKDTISGNKVNTADSNHLSANVNDVVIETNLWPGETSSESSASNAVSEEAFVSPMECSGEDYNLYFMPEEEMKDYLDGSDDISSILNSTLPFDDSSLPSVDGWSEYLRPEDVLSTSNELHVDGEQPLINTLGEKSFDLWRADLN